MSGRIVPYRLYIVNEIENYVYDIALFFACPARGRKTASDLILFSSPQGILCVLPRAITKHGANPAGKIHSGLLEKSIIIVNENHFCLLYFLRVARPPRMCRSALFRSSSARTWANRPGLTRGRRSVRSLCTVDFDTPNFFAAARTVARFSMMYTARSQARSSKLSRTHTTPLRAVFVRPRILWVMYMCGTGRFSTSRYSPPDPMPYKATFLFSQPRMKLRRCDGNDLAVPKITDNSGDDAVGHSAFWIDTVGNAR